MDIQDPKYFSTYSICVDTQFLEKSTGEAIFKLSVPLKNIVRLRLVSYEIPNTEFMFSNAKNNIMFTLTDDLGEHTFYLVPGNYSIDELINLIQGWLSSLTGTYTIEIGPGKRVYIRGVGTFILNFYDTKGLGYQLGFRQSVYVGSDLYISESTAILMPDHYYYLQVQDANGMIVNVANGTYLEVFTKIIVDGAETITFKSDNNNMRNEYVYKQPTNINQLRVRLVNMYGEPVNLNGADYSLTFEVTEVMDIKDYRGLLSKDGGQTVAWGAAIQAARDGPRRFQPF